MFSGRPHRSLEEVLFLPALPSFSLLKGRCGPSKTFGNSAKPPPRLLYFDYVLITESGSTVAGFQDGTMVAAVYGMTVRKKRVTN